MVKDDPGSSPPFGELSHILPAINRSPASNSTTINESIITLLLKLHSKLSGKPDSYSPISQRSKDPKLAGSCSQAYQDCRIGDGCFFIEKVLDKICDLDAHCEQFINVSRAQV